MLIEETPYYISIMKTSSGPILRYARYVYKTSQFIPTEIRTMHQVGFALHRSLVVSVEMAQSSPKYSI